MGRGRGGGGGGGGGVYYQARAAHHPTARRIITQICTGIICRYAASGVQAYVPLFRTHGLPCFQQNTPASTVFSTSPTTTPPPAQSPPISPRIPRDIKGYSLSSPSPPCHPQALRPRTPADTPGPSVLCQLCFGVCLCSATRRVSSTSRVVLISRMRLPQGRLPSSS